VSVRFTCMSVLICSLLACGEREVQLEEAYRKKADSIYASEIDQIGDEIDSLCLQMQDSLIQVKYDSIVRTRKQKIRELSQ